MSTITCPHPQDADPEALGLQRRHQFAVAGLDDDVELGGIGQHAAEQVLVLDLLDLAAGAAE